MLRWHLEELRFSFGHEPFVDLQGLLIAERGNYAIIVAADLGAQARLAFYLHSLGHVALGHVDANRLTVAHEFRDRWRLPPATQAREVAADRWALHLLDDASAPDAAARVFTPNLLARVAGLDVPADYLDAFLPRWRAALAADPALAAHLRASLASSLASWPAHAHSIGSGLPARAKRPTRRAAPAAFRRTPP